MRSILVTEQDVQRDIREVLKDEARPRSMLVAYILWLFLFWTGAHRFYLGRPRSGVLMLACSALTLGIGGVVWACVDAFLIPRMVDERNVRFIEPHWMRVQAVDGMGLDSIDPVRGEPRPMPAVRPSTPDLQRDLDDRPAREATLYAAPDVDLDEPRFIYRSSLPFLRRPVDREPPLAAA